MSIVAVHGPNTFGSGAVGEAGPVMAVVNPANGLIWDFKLDGPTTRVNADFSWAFPPNGTPTPQVLADPTPVTYATAGSKTATLTVTGAGTGANPYPPAGSYPITITAVVGVAPLMPGEGGGEGGGEGETPPETPQAPEQPEVEPPEAEVPPEPEPEPAPPEPEPEPAPEPEAEDYDPGDYTVDEVKAHADGLETAEEVQALLDLEVANKNRVTLVEYLESMLPYDPEVHTVQEVVDYATENPEELADIIEAERAGKNRSTLLSQLEGLQTT